MIKDLNKNQIELLKKIPLHGNYFGLNKGVFGEGFEIGLISAYLIFDSIDFEFSSERFVSAIRFNDFGKSTPITELDGSVLYIDSEISDGKVFIDIQEASLLELCQSIESVYAKYFFTAKFFNEGYKYAYRFPYHYESLWK